ncbi:MAG TPA: hypothetical protein PL084_00780, partial [Chitinophagales bacterium]|nr:hypothetical protein [Chitinophagales bacterium]
MKNTLLFISLALSASVLNAQRNQNIASFDEAETFVPGKYTGKYNEKGEKHGHGKAVLSTGEVYDGEWANDKRNGFGKATMKDGAAYTGEWKDNKRSGQGIYTFLNGDKYVGLFTDNKMNGAGIYYYADGDRY